jgi:hypothetical protein
MLEQWISDDVSMPVDDEGNIGRQTEQYRNVSERKGRVMDDDTCTTYGPKERGNITGSQRHRKNSAQRGDGLNGDTIDLVFLPDSETPG